MTEKMGDQAQGFGGGWGILSPLELSLSPAWPLLPFPSVSRPIYFIRDSVS